jgi:predicted nuclease of restriction endonuclease-like (RecB) superfamily
MRKAKAGEPEKELTPQIFEEISRLIINARENALRKVNEEQINLYSSLGRLLYQEREKHAFGDGYIDEIAMQINNRFPGLKGFTRRGLYRMIQFYETYKDDEFVSPLVTQLGWTNHLLIMAHAKTPEERYFYVQLCIKERYSKRELERQLDSSYYERYMLSSQKLPPEPVRKHIGSRFLDKYVLEFLDLPGQYSELDFKRAIIANLKTFILEVGKDFTFAGEEYRVQVGGEDFYIDLLFYHRELSCLVAFELKTGPFKPEYIGKMNFYLEALDREHRRKNENPSVGIILCTGKNKEVVEFALSRSMSPPMVAEYTLKLPDKKLLQEKLHEFAEISGLMGEVSDK